MTQYRIFHPQSSKFVVPKELSVPKGIESSTSNVEFIYEGSGTAPSYGRELIFSESDGEDSYFELIPEGKWSHIKHVKDGMYVTRARAPSSPHITLMLSDREPKSADLFKYQKRKHRIKCKTPPRWFLPRWLRWLFKVKEFWYGYNPDPDTPVYVVNRHVGFQSHPAAFNFMMEEVWMDGITHVQQVTATLIISPEQFITVSLVNWRLCAFTVYTALLYCTCLNLVCLASYGSYIFISLFFHRFYDANAKSNAENAQIARA